MAAGQCSTWSWQFLLWNMLAVSTKQILFIWFNILSKAQYWVNELKTWKTDQNDSFNLSNFLTTTMGEENRGLVGDKTVPDLWLTFCPNILSFCWLSLVAFGKSSFQIFVTIRLFGWVFCVVQQAVNFHHHDYEWVNF